MLSKMGAHMYCSAVNALHSPGRVPSSLLLLISSNWMTDALDIDAHVAGSVPVKKFANR